MNDDISKREKSMENSVHYHLSDEGIANVTLNRVELHNAFDDAMIETMIEILWQIKNEPKARILVLRSAAKSFSAGADLAWMKRVAGYDFDSNVSDAVRMADMYSAIYFMEIPTIAVVNGAAYGGGLGLLAACDFAIGGPSASMCLSEVALGLVPAVVSPFVIDAIGVKAFKRLSISAAKINANEALRLGLLSHLVEADALEHAVETLVQQCLRNGPAAMAATKALANEMAHQTIGEHTKQVTSHTIATLRGSEEGRAGISAFLEKRPAPWRK